jgi:hypothetical protein
MAIIRWVLVFPSAVAGWYFALFIGLALYELANYFCPPELMISGSCQASWFDPFIDVLIVFSSSLSAVFAILFAVIVVPNKRVLVAKFIYFGGFILALYFVYETSRWGAFWGAIISGALLLLLLLNYSKVGERS